VNLPHPDHVSVLELTDHRSAVVAEFFADQRAHRLTLPRSDAGGFTLASVDRPGPGLERWQGDAWDACEVDWTSPASLSAFAAWCVRADAGGGALPFSPEEPDHVVGIAPAPRPASPRVELSDILPISKAAAALARIIRSGRPHAVTQKGRVAVIVVPVALWEELTRAERRDG
jgi:hypothetical protein